MILYDIVSYCLNKKVLVVKNKIDLIQNISSNQELGRLKEEQKQLHQILQDTELEISKHLQAEEHKESKNIIALKEHAKILKQSIAAKDDHIAFFEQNIDLNPFLDDPQNAKESKNKIKNQKRKQRLKKFKESKNTIDLKDGEEIVKQPTADKDSPIAFFKKNIISNALLGQPEDAKINKEKPKNKQEKQESKEEEQQLKEFFEKYKCYPMSDISSDLNVKGIMDIRPVQPQDFYFIFWYDVIKNVFNISAYLKDMDRSKLREAPCVMIDKGNLIESKNVRNCEEHEIKEYMDRFTLIAKMLPKFIVEKAIYIEQSAGHFENSTHFTVTVDSHMKQMTEQDKTRLSLTNNFYMLMILSLYIKLLPQDQQQKIFSELKTVGIDFLPDSIEIKNLRTIEYAYLEFLGGKQWAAEKIMSNIKGFEADADITIYVKNKLGEKKAIKTFNDAHQINFIHWYVEHRPRLLELLQMRAKDGEFVKQCKVEFTKSGLVDKNIIDSCVDEESAVEAIGQMSDQYNYFSQYFYNNIN